MRLVDPQDTNIVEGRDGGGSTVTREIAHLAEAIPRLERGEFLAAFLHHDVAGYEDTEGVVVQTFFDDHFTGAVLLPIPDTQDFLQLGVGKVVEERDLSRHRQLVCLRLLGGAARKRWKSAHQIRREIATGLIAPVRILRQGPLGDVDHVFGKIGAYCHQRWRFFVDDIFEKLGETPG